ncbi:trigger factor [Paroceanicella profunda]|uniref:Trigger factor n=1 Tax=Paroceanicella profunda TaxID=2579971 RepID=A0A5B8FXA9_9RHOB|nr:DUF6314 family protein [Paroceanicella profunda]QDL91840.1 trigger factor [Paroceanicella profunda]
MEKATGAAARFLGHWQVDRHVHDLDAARTGRFEGRASFSPVPGGLLYEEMGTLRLGGLAMRAARRYLYRFPEGGEVRVYFDDGRFFHAFDPGAARAEALHLCPPDRYEVAYLFGPDPHDWRSEWRVEGPRKDYRLVTRYTRPA